MSIFLCALFLSGDSPSAILNHYSTFQKIRLPKLTLGLIGAFFIRTSYSVAKDPEPYDTLHLYPGAALLAGPRRTLFGQGTGLIGDMIGALNYADRMEAGKRRKIKGSKRVTNIATRTYRSETRQLQKQSTRTRIIKAARDIQAECGETHVTYQAVAKRAKVGLRTVFRAFPNRSELFAAMDEPIILSVSGAIHEMNELPAALGDLIEQFEQAQASSARCALSADTTTAIQQLLRRSFDPDREKIAAITELLLQPMVWKILTDQLVLSKDDLQATLLWAIERVTGKTLVVPSTSNVDKTEEDEPFID